MTRSRISPPEWWDENTQIILTKDLTCKRHKDGNKEHSWLVWVGDFTEGALHFDDGIKIEEKYKWHGINGQTHHWNDSHEGTKYAIIIFRSGRNPKSNKMHEARMRKKDEKERELRRDYLEAVSKIIAPDRDAKALVEEVMRENP
jgi:hypothetical protein